MSSYSWSYIKTTTTDDDDDDDVIFRTNKTMQWLMMMIMMDFFISFLPYDKIRQEQIRIDETERCDTI